MKINVIYNKNIEGYDRVLTSLENELIFRKAEFKTFSIDKMEHYGDISLVIGGDGTLIKAAKFYSKSKVPVMGINNGRLGFLTQDTNVTDLVSAVLSGNYHVEERLTLYSGDKVALNDFVIKGCDSSRTSKFYLDINGKEVCDYIADGIIISTPTGSTAYGLSAGGPVLHPGIYAISIVPICPHTLNARPLIVPVTDHITVKTGDKLLSVTVDGEDNEECVERITIKTDAHHAYLAFLAKDRFYSVIRNKLHWGIPSGNI